MRQMKILAFMQNAWFHNPEKVRHIMAAMTPERAETYRRRLIAYSLFAGCKSGRVLEHVFGKRLCQEIVWEESTKDVGGHASSVFPADIEHIRSRIIEESPQIVLSFGGVATDGVIAATREFNTGHFAQVTYIGGPHPTARAATTKRSLESMAANLQRVLATPRFSR